MLSRKNIIVGMLALAAGLGTFVATKAARSAAPAPVVAALNDPSETLLDWLAVPENQRAPVRAQDSTFTADMRTLVNTLATQRTALADVLKDSEAPDELVTSSVEAVISANAAVERRITRYLLAVRSDLTPDQRQQLFGLCASVCQGGGMGWRGGQGMGMGQGMGNGMGMGRGMGRGMGQGMGQGRGRMGGRGGAGQGE
jgi:hypothetical protein